STANDKRQTTNGKRQTTNTPINVFSLLSMVFHIPKPKPPIIRHLHLQQESPRKSRLAARFLGALRHVFEGILRKGKGKGKGEAARDTVIPSATVGDSQWLS